MSLLAGGYYEQSRDDLSAYIHSRLDEEFPFLANDSEAKVILRGIIYDLASHRRKPEMFLMWLAKHFNQKAMLDDAYLPVTDQENPEFFKLSNTFKLVIEDLYQAMRGLEADEYESFFADLRNSDYYEMLGQLLMNFIAFDAVILKCLSYFYPERDFTTAAPVVLSQEQVDYLRNALQSYLEQGGAVDLNEKGLTIDTDLFNHYFKTHSTNLFPAEV